MTIDELIQLAEAEEETGSETGALIEKSAIAFDLPLVVRERIWKLLEIFAEREAALVLLESALPGWTFNIESDKGYCVDLYSFGNHQDESSVEVYHDDLARAITIATLKAYREVSG